MCSVLFCPGKLWFVDVLFCFAELDFLTNFFPPQDTPICPHYHHFFLTAALPCYHLLPGTFVYSSAINTFLSTHTLYWSPQLSHQMISPSPLCLSLSSLPLPLFPATYPITLSHLHPSPVYCIDITILLLSLHPFFSLHCQSSPSPPVWVTPIPTLHSQHPLSSTTHYLQISLTSPPSTHIIASFVPTLFYLFLVGPLRYPHLLFLSLPHSTSLFPPSCLLSSKI